uniref:Ubiquinone biosynthesis O-methyltransferase n=1 Tax=uncultured organism TaxID=155900 RepID=A0A7L9QBZ4_9ZZZZ|nr:ubiquinone biosynthesis O-methyltransferase [uncultured organism]
MIGDTVFAHSYSPVEFQAIDRCRLCAAPASAGRNILDRVPDLDTGDDRFALVECRTCGLVTTSPIPTAETIHYLYEDSASSDYELPQPGLIGRLKDAFAERTIRSIVTGCRGFVPREVLDFGTGGGRYAAACARVWKDANVTGVDFAPVPPRGSYYAVSDRLSYRPYAEVKEAGHVFDLILARHVLEHLHDPIAAIKEWLELLAPGGILYLEVPNRRSRTATLLGKRWPLLYVPKHLSHFDSASLDRTVRAAGSQAAIGRTEIPMMGNVVALLLGQSRYDPRFRILGLGLHWFQILFERSAAQGTCLTATIIKAS